MQRELQRQVRVERDAKAAVSLAGFQEALAALYVDAGLRASFWDDPTRLRGFRLAPSERRALAALDRRSLERFCRGLAAKRGKIK